MDGYNNRTTFWSLKYRGKLRKKILDYAFERDLMHPEDCGTMTHWYSRTPLAFLEKVKPTLLAQESKSYSEQTGLVWDIYDERNRKNYQKLTDTHIAEYGRPDLFHTIGLAERSFGNDRKKGMEIKKYAYGKITEYIEKQYPNAPLLVASWDFYSRYQPQEVRELMKELDPKRHIILDYTVDLKAEHNDFEAWDVLGKIPWIFGIFHGYMPQSHVHGDYPYLNKKLKKAAADPFCKGMAFWPELSHSDTLMLEYFTENAWCPEALPLEQVVDRFCEKRYGEDSPMMTRLWHAFLPVYDAPSGHGGYMASFFDLFSEKKVTRKILDREHPQHSETIDLWRERIREAKSFETAMAKTVEMIGKLPKELLEKPFIRRDAVDLLRTIAVKKLDYDFLNGAIQWMDHGDQKETGKIWKRCVEELEIFSNILALQEEYSLFHTLKGLKRVSSVNPHFSDAIKDNTVNWYCRSAVYETVKYIYLPEMKVFTEKILSQSSSPYPDFADEKKQIFGEFMKTDFYDMKPKKQDYRKICKEFLNYFR